MGHGPADLFCRQKTRAPSPSEPAGAAGLRSGQPRTRELPTSTGFSWHHVSQAGAAGAQHRAQCLVPTRHARRLGPGQRPAVGFSGRAAPPAVARRAAVSQQRVCRAPNDGRRRVAAGPDLQPQRSRQRNRRQASTGQRLQLSIQRRHGRQHPLFGHSLQRQCQGRRAGFDQFLDEPAGASAQSRYCPLGRPHRAGHGQVDPSRARPLCQWQSARPTRQISPRAA